MLPGALKSLPGVREQLLSQRVGDTCETSFRTRWHERCILFKDDGCEIDLSLYRDARLPSPSPRLAMIQSSRRDSRGRFSVLENTRVSCVDYLRWKNDGTLASWRRVLSRLLGSHFGMAEGARHRASSGDSNDIIEREDVTRNLQLLSERMFS